MIGTSVDRYEILEELGHGGMSVVYRGRDSSLEREVAVKVLHNHLAKKLENRRRFHREAKAIARLRHPNILEIYDFSSEDEDRSYIVMEYVAGENLRQFVARTGTPTPEIAAIMGVEICRALECAHDHGIIHRDLKPENVMVSSDGALKLMDFGIAHVIDAETMTATGSLMGSPAHMAPELIDGVPVDVRTDVFALGTVLYWLATGTLPFDGANAPQVLKRVLSGDYEDPDVAEPRVGRRVGAIIKRCLSHEPADRYPSVAAVRAELEAFAASMGLGEPDRELVTYIRDPDAYRVAFADVVVERLTVLARQAQRARDIPGAIALFNRILAYDPQNREVARLLDNLCRQDRWRRMAPWSVAATLLVGVIVAYLAVAPQETVAPTPPRAAPAPIQLPVDEAAARVANGTAAASTRSVETKAVEIAARVVDRGRSWEGGASRPAELKLAPKPLALVIAAVPDMGAPPDVGGAPLPSHRWRFKVIPAAALFEIDGEGVETMRAASGVALTEGVHTIKAQATGAKPYVKSINVRGPRAPEFPVVLEWEQARVKVVGNVDLVVWFDGARDMKPIGRNGKFNVAFGPADSTQSQKEITVRAAPALDVTTQDTQTVTVQPGGTQTVTFAFELNPEP